MTPAVDGEQAKIISQATGSVEIRDRQGKHLDYVAHGFTGEDVAVAKQRQASDEPRHTTEQVIRRRIRRNAIDFTHGTV